MFVPMNYLIVPLFIAEAGLPAEQGPEDTAPDLTSQSTIHTVAAVSTSTVSVIGWATYDISFMLEIYLFPSARAAVWLG